MSLVLKAINGKIDSLSDQLTVVTKELIVVKEENIVLKKEIVALKARLAVYETPKDSHNSSIPPSKESIKAQALRITRSLREKSDKPPGGQIGHKGMTLEMVSVADIIKQHKPEYCTRCGNDLSLIEGSVVGSRQSIDIPLPIRPIVTEHQVIGKKCSCGYCCQMDFPKELRSSISYGTNVRALVIYLSIVQFVPYKRITEILNDFLGVSMSQGTVNNILQDAKLKSQGAYDEIRNQIEQASVVGADETGENINGKLHWMWAWQTPKLTYVYSDKSRGKVAIENHFKDGLKKATLITDRHASYFNMKVKDHQICLAHILRELIYLTELDPQQTWSSELAELIREAIHKRKSKDWKELNRESILDRFKKILETCTDNFHRKIIALQKSLIKHKESVFRFLFNPDIPYENNASERAVRPLKVKQKVSGMFKTNKGATAFCQIHSITQTAKKNNQNPFSAILAVANNF